MAQQVSAGDRTTVNPVGVHDGVGGEFGHHQAASSATSASPHSPHGGHREVPGRAAPLARSRTSAPRPAPGLGGPANPARVDDRVVQPAHLAKASISRVTESAGKPQNTRRWVRLNSATRLELAGVDKPVVPQQRDQLAVGPDRPSAAAACLISDR